MAKQQRRIMRDFVIKELSAVDRPAQAGAVMTIMKRDDNPEGEVPMTAAEKQQLDELQKKIDALTKTAPADDKQAAAFQETLKRVSTEFAALTKRLEAADAERAELVAKAGMSDDEKEYCAGMDAEAKKEFWSMSPEDRRKKMKKAVDDNPVVYKSERTSEEFRKNDDPRIVKYAKQADEDAGVAKAERTKREDAEYSKRADDELKPFSDDIAKGDVKIAVLRGIDKMDEAPRAALLKMLAVGGKAIQAAFAKIGHSQETVLKSAGDFNKRVDEIMSRDKVSKLAALEKAQREYPDEFSAYQSSGAVLSN